MAGFTSFWLWNESTLIFNTEVFMPKPLGLHAHLGMVSVSDFFLQPCCCLCSFGCSISQRWLFPHTLLLLEKSWEDFCSSNLPACIVSLKWQQLWPFTSMHGAERQHLITDTPRTGTLSLPDPGLPTGRSHIYHHQWESSLTFLLVPETVPSPQSQAHLTESSHSYFLQGGSRDPPSII